VVVEFHPTTLSFSFFSFLGQEKEAIEKLVSLLALVTIRKY